jgi:murein DD-endopeptidase MepM/ murein hydrolase activator NlpD
VHALCSSLTLAAALAATPAAPAPPTLPSGLVSPMPGGVVAGYPADTGLDIAGMSMPVFSIAAGTVDYAEAGHSAWTSKRDSPFTVRIELDRPIEHEGRSVTHVWYAHLSELAFEQAEGATPRRRVEAGERIGTSGVARGAWHLHLGLLLDGDVSQHWGTFLGEAEVREVLGGSTPLRAGSRLPAMAKPKR